MSDELLKFSACGLGSLPGTVDEVSARLVSLFGSALGFEKTV